MMICVSVVTHATGIVLTMNVVYSTKMNGEVRALHINVFCGAFKTPKEIMKDFEKVTNLQDRIKAGEQFEFEFFWKGPFSQWDKHGFTVDGVFYKTAEHWMMAEKARIFGDNETMRMFGHKTGT
jgi:hypothetical protein